MAALPGSVADRYTSRQSPLEKVPQCWPMADFELVYVFVYGPCGEGAREREAGAAMSAR